MNSYKDDASGYDFYTRVSGYARAPRRLAAVFRAVAGIMPPETAILDFGCGTGQLAAVLRAQAPDARIVGMEPCAEMAARCWDKFLNDRRFRMIGKAFDEDACHLPLAADMFDVVASTGVFDHLQITSAVMVEFLRVVKPGGHLAFTYERHGDGNGGPKAHDRGTFYSHAPDYVRRTLEDAGAAVLHEERMMGYVLPRVARFGLIIARKPDTLRASA